ncbi:mycofactocin system GMC family oxidoreductase MftG [Blastococcus sp. TF02A-30]|uniref:mycofactocin dehydrogenase MftG n=1 Tax=Blastococcus sp. TF02A-30 TaxID=2250580 RepID=UPI000DEA2059|nr:mycofactocin system GMC family oxidoreductase MftG [Blastococcus sp. TF02A-30]RBY92938.1 mycofactocin system GMC family oxidoreductase MftG [Blastococcus sp. TF02A-30]
MADPAWDVVVVGAGTAGCAVAARLADAGRRVLLLEAGTVPEGPGDWPPELRDPADLAAARPGHPANWDLPAALTDDLVVRVPRGRVAGGSSAINAAVFLRATAADLDRWAATGPLWAPAAVLAAYRRSEADADFGGSPLHGADGPVPVRRLPSPSPLADGMATAAAELGFPDEPDKNGAGPAGYGPIPFNVAGGVRINAAMAYLAPRAGSARLTVRGDAVVRRVLVERGRAVGVVTDDGPVRAGEVVLSAGAVGTPHLLLRSGLGPAADLTAAGIDVVADLPGVGSGSGDHPLVYVPFLADPGSHRSTARLHGVLHASVDGTADGEVELLPWLRPFGGEPELSIGVGLQRPVARGRLRLGADPDGPPLVEYRYLTGESDRARLRAGVRLAARLLATDALRDLGAGRVAPGAAVLEDDRLLDRWIREHLTTAVHLSATARSGPDGDPGAVVDQELRVRGVDGLRLADTSVLPDVPTRGPAATAVMVGERAAEVIGG